MEAAVPPLALTPGFMAQRVDDFGQDQSHAVYDALRDGGALNETGYLISDPRCACGTLISGRASVVACHIRACRGAWLLGTSMRPAGGPLAIDACSFRHRSAETSIQDVLVRSLFLRMQVK